MSGRTAARVAVLGCCAALAVLVARARATEAASVPADLQEQARSIFAVLPPEAESASNPLTPEKIELGRMLYYEKRLSINDELSCNSCHALSKYGVDNEPTSPGHEGKRGGRNSPTVYNAAFHVAQFWDGRAADVEEQAKGPVLNPVEMGMPDAAYVVRVLSSIPGYRPLFVAAFPGEPDPITYDNAARAIGAFERKLVTPSRFDVYLAGDASALTASEQEGLSTFIAAGCPACHLGATVGGRTYQKLGVAKPYPTEDVGRAAVTKNEADRFVFKVPSLRNVKQTGPYFHDGRVATLDQAVRLMAEHQLGKDLTDAQVKSITTFLGSLTGVLPLGYIREPKLPPSGPDTPKPAPAPAPATGG